MQGDHSRVRDSAGLMNLGQNGNRKCIEIEKSTAILASNTSWTTNSVLKKIKICNHSLHLVQKKVQYSVALEVKSACSFYLHTFMISILGQSSPGLHE